MLSARQLVGANSGGDADDGDGDEAAAKRRAEEDEAFARAAAAISDTLVGNRRDDLDGNGGSSSHAPDDLSAHVLGQQVFAPRPGYDYHANGLAVLRAALVTAIRARRAAPAASAQPPALPNADADRVEDAATTAAADRCFASVLEAAGQSVGGDVGAALGATPERLAAFYASGAQQRELMPETSLLKLNTHQRAAVALVLIAELDKLDLKEVMPVRMLLHGVAGTGARARVAHAADGK